jgi:uncharacterized protein YjiS (DUF1127 family)
MSTMIDAAPPLPLSFAARFDAPPQGNSWGIVLAPWRLARLWAERRAQRIALRELAETPHLLSDLGLARARALREAGKPFWQA